MTPILIAVLYAALLLAVWRARSEGRRADDLAIRLMRAEMLCEDAQRTLAIERMAVENLVLAIKRGEGEAAVRAWEETNDV